MKTALIFYVDRWGPIVFIPVFFESITEETRWQFDILCREFSAFSRGTSGRVFTIATMIVITSGAFPATAAHRHLTQTTSHLSISISPPSFSLFKHPSSVSSLPTPSHYTPSFEVAILAMLAAEGLWHCWLRSQYCSMSRIACPSSSLLFFISNFSLFNCLDLFTCIIYSLAIT